MKKAITLLLSLLLPLLSMASDRVITTDGDSIALQRGGSLLVMPNTDYYRWDKDNPFENQFFVYSRTTLAFDQSDGKVTDIMLYKWLQQTEIVRFDHGHAILESPDTAVYKDGYTLFVHGESLYFSKLENAVERPIGVLASLSHRQLLRLHEEGVVKDTTTTFSPSKNLSYVFRCGVTKVTKASRSYKYESFSSSSQHEFSFETYYIAFIAGIAIWSLTLILKLRLGLIGGWYRLTAIIPVLILAIAFWTSIHEPLTIIESLGEPALFVKGARAIMLFAAIMATILPFIIEFTHKPKTK